VVPDPCPSDIENSDIGKYIFNQPILWRQSKIMSKKRVWYRLILLLPLFKPKRPLSQKLKWRKQDEFKDQ
jgi:hypothetical protein